VDEFPDFPKKGILFRDFGSILRDPQALHFAVDELSKRFPMEKIDAFAGIESRGFILACAMTLKHNKGMITIRKAGKLPGQTLKRSYSIEYGEDVMEIQRHAVQKGQNVLICDDLLATGGTAQAAAGLIEDAGGAVAGFAFFIELSDLGGAKRISAYNFESLIKY